jgi:tRNA threonylcarbamoyladenosine biosynthesis protein TsaB
VLFLDAASPRLHAGLLCAANAAPAWRDSDDEAGVALFRETDELMRATGLTIGDIRTVVFCDGPGSLLGVRVAAMALRTWLALPRAQPLRVLAYRSLTLVAADLLAHGEPPPFHVISDARRDSWNVLSVAADGVIGTVRRVAATALPPDGVSFLPETFPVWQARPTGARTAPYRPHELPVLAARFSLWHETTAPDAFLTELPTYRTWKGASDS